MIQRLLDDGALSGSLTTKRLSRFAARRLFERLQSSRRCASSPAAPRSDCLDSSDGRSLRPPQAERTAGLARHRARTFTGRTALARVDGPRRSGCLCGQRTSAARGAGAGRRQELQS
ncbi:hypothetical protein [Mesorhizobium sp. M0106]|uniref:hypothetical protein n=1 Tax=Mesorhizobium sp. M0106 TaxID=2956880 RepID=UPI0033351B52